MSVLIISNERLNQNYLANLIKAAFPIAAIALVMIHHVGAVLALAIPSSQMLNPVRPGTLLINAGFISDRQADVSIIFGIGKNY